MVGPQYFYIGKHPSAATIDTQTCKDPEVPESPTNLRIKSRIKQYAQNKTRIDFAKVLLIFRKVNKIHISSLK